MVLEDVVDGLPDRLTMDEPIVYKEVKNLLLVLKFLSFHLIAVIQPRKH